MNAKSRTEYSIINIITGLGGYFVNTILGLLCRMVFTRILSEEYLGINGLFTNILSMLSLAELGIGSAIVYALYKPLAQNDTNKITALVQFYGKCYRIVGVVVAVLGVFLIPFLNVLIHTQPNITESIYTIYIIFLFNTASTYFFSYRSSLIAAAQKNYIVIGVNYIITIIQSVIQIGWLCITHNYLGYLLIQTLGTLIYNITISKIAVKEFPFIVEKNSVSLEKKERRSLIKNVRALIIWKLSGLLVNSTDNIIITFFSGLSAVGLSSNYMLLSGTLNGLLNQIFSSISASVGNLNAISSTEKKENMFYTINLMNYWLYAWTAIGIFVCSSDIVHVMFGKDYVMHISIPFVIALNYYMVGMQNIVWTYKNTMGIFRQGRYLLIFTAIINLTCSIFMGRIWGVFGIFFATAVSRVLTNVWYDAYAVFKYGLQTSSCKYFKEYIKCAVLTIVLGASCYLICEILQGNIIFRMLMKIIICSIIVNVVFWIVFHKKEEFIYYKRFISKLIRNIKVVKDE